MDASISRRRFLELGAGGALGLALSGGLLPRVWAQGTSERSERAGQAEALIILYMSGGMSQTDTFDPKPQHANAGPLKAIKTAAKGLQLSELLPGLAEEARELAVIRSMATREGAHERARYLLHTGYLPSGTVKHPDLGTLVSEARPDPELDIPAYCCVNGPAVGAGFLGVQHAPLTVGDPNRPLSNLKYPKKVDAKRFEKRRQLLEAIEKRFRKDHPGSETRGHTDIYTKADAMMHSPRIAAFELDEEPKALRDAYGRNRFGQGCLMARRLIQNGVKAVEVQLGGWDTHQDNFTRNRELAGRLDAGFATLIRDLRDKDLLRSTLILCMTEFGRTPVINANDGRDHFASGWSVALAGGGIRGGQAIGATSEDGLQVAARPLTAPDLLRSVFHALALDANYVNDTPAGRPVRRVDEAGQLIEELFA